MYTCTCFSEMSSYAYVSVSFLIMEFEEVNGTQLIDWVCYFDQSSVKHFGITTSHGPSTTITVLKVASVIFKVTLGSLN